MMSFKPALSFHTTLRQAAGPQWPLLIRFLGAHFLMLNSEVRRRRWYLVSMATSGNSRQIYSWNATQGLGCAPALSWLPYIQNGIPVRNARSHDREGQTYIAMLASHPNIWPNADGRISNEACLKLCCLRTCVRGCVPVELAAAPQKVGLRACNSRPSVWPPLAHEPK